MVALRRRSPPSSALRAPSPPLVRGGEGRECPSRTKRSVRQRTENVARLSQAENGLPTKGHAYAPSSPWPLAPSVHLSVFRPLPITRCDSLPTNRLLPINPLAPRASHLAPPLSTVVRRAGSPIYSLMRRFRGHLRGKMGCKNRLLILLLCWWEPLFGFSSSTFKSTAWRLCKLSLRISRRPDSAIASVVTDELQPDDASNAPKDLAFHQPHKPSSSKSSGVPSHAESPVPSTNSGIGKGVSAAAADQAGSAATIHTLKRSQHDSHCLISSALFWLFRRQPRDHNERRCPW